MSVVAIGLGSGAIRVERCENSNRRCAMIRWTMLAVVLVVGGGPTPTHRAQALDEGTLQPIQQVDEDALPVVRQVGGIGGLYLDVDEDGNPIAVVLGPNDLVPDEADGYTAAVETEDPDDPADGMAFTLYLSKRRTTVQLFPIPGILTVWIHADGAVTIRVDYTDTDGNGHVIGWSIWLDPLGGWVVNQSVDGGPSQQIYPKK
jgi:hypothetical protein